MKLDSGMCTKYMYTMCVDVMTSLSDHGGGSWSGQRFNANFHTPKPDKPVVNQHFSTLYKPVVMIKKIILAGNLGHGFSSKTRGPRAISLT